MLKLNILGKNRIGDEGIIDIAESLAKNSSLNILNIGKWQPNDFLAFNYITKSGATSIANMLKQNKTLSSLDISINKHISIILGFNNIGNDNTIINTLKDNKTITKLDLSKQHLYLHY